jgi:large subunit ribosomal protein L15
MSEFQVKAPKGANKNKKIAGRGRASGSGKTSGKGHKGQKARSGGGTRIGFEGGQMPLYRRVAARGFSNHPFKTEYTALNVSSLENVFADGDSVTLETLVTKGLIKKSETLVKILGQGELTKKLEVAVPALSASAKEKIEKAGGKVVVPTASDEKSGK